MRALKAVGILWSFLALCVGLGFSGEALAQTDAEYLSVINFRFSNPGARARAMGGALVALADDDSTAAFVNPGGLAFFDRSQVSVEYVSEEDEFLSPRVETGLNLDGTPSRTPGRRTIQNESNFLSFASYLQPILPNKLVVSAFYGKLLDTESGVDVFIDSAFFPEIDSDLVFRPVTNTASAINEVYGASAGWRLGENLGIGMAVGISELSFEGISRRGELFDPADTVNIQSSVVDAETDLFFTLGGLWRISDRWVAGLSWQKQTSYDMDNRFEVVGFSFLDRSFQSEFTIPTRIAGGWVYRGEKWVVSFEADHIQYSDLFEQAEGVTFFGETAEDASYGYAIPDVTELHLGFERTFTTATAGQSWSLRAGVWRDEAHLPYYTGSDPLQRAWAPRLDDEIYHWTVGGGFEAERFALGIAGDFSSDAGTDVLVSAIFKL